MLHIQFSVVLLALLVSLLPALWIKREAVRQFWREVVAELDYAMMRRAWPGAELGAVAYKTPGAATTAPTAIQAKSQTLQVAEVTFADADTTFPVVTNLAEQTATFSPNTGQDLPKVTLTIKTPGTAFPALSAAWTDGNTVTINKANTTFGSGCVVVVYIETPHSIVGVR